MIGKTDKLEKIMCQAWVNFAETGNPNHPGMPNWPTSSSGKEETMIFKENCEVKENYDNKLIDLHYNLSKKNS